MTLFIFAGDMLVMLFMVVLATWVFFLSSDEKTEHSANIPLCDDSICDQSSSLSTKSGEKKIS